MPRLRCSSTRASVICASAADAQITDARDRKSTRLNSSQLVISYAVFCLEKKIRFLVDDTAHGDGCSAGLAHLQLIMAKKSGGSRPLLGITIRGAAEQHGPHPGAFAALS